MGSDAPVLWFTGLSGAGKTTIARAVKAEFEARGIRVEMLDGDEVRATLSSDLGFTKEHRDLQVGRIAWVASLLARNEVVVLVSAISPYRDSRSDALGSFARGFEIFVDAPLEVVEERDTKGLYQKARLGEIKGFTGIDDPYEKPLQPDLHLNTDVADISESVAEVLRLLSKENVIDVV